MRRWFTIARKRLSRMSLVVLVGCIRTVASFLPFRLAVLSGGWLGSIAFYLLPRDRKRAMDNLTAVFPEKGPVWVRRTAKAMFVHLGKSLLEAVALTGDKIQALIEWRGLENLHGALLQGKGLVFVTGHIGNWEIMAGAVAAECPLSVIAAPIEPDAVNDTIIDLREKLGVRTIVRSRPGATKELIRVFREKRVMGLLIDQDTDVDGVFVDFMGRPAWTPSAAASMAIKFDAPVVFGYIERLPDDRHRITIEGPLDIEKTGNAEKDVLVNTAVLTKRIEKAIYRHPEQWVWMHRRWRRQP
ncbi:MAG: lysophospholipid acyltransferase family protein [Nitrospirota bacterium]|nr:lysophospholipid acyltransferase family protein [Nitrospirota bacterium]